MTFKYQLNKLIYDIPSEEYHGIEGTFSSSQLKKMNEDPEHFYKKYITKELPKDESPAFIVGTYFHTMVLEPEKAAEECGVWKGVRSGKKWDDFKAANPNKAMITEGEYEKITRTIKAVQDSPIAMSLINKAKKEVSVFVKVYVYKGEVYTYRNEKLLVLFSGGWAAAGEDLFEKVEMSGLPLILKVRADGLCPEEKWVLDLKSASGNMKNKHDVKAKVAALDYELSAALYLDIFTLTEDGEEYDKFYWIFGSKDMFNSKTYLANNQNIMVGRSEWRKAVLELAFYIKNKWAFEDRLEEIGPASYKLEWLHEI